jgi:hypothetical protein
MEDHLVAELNRLLAPSVRDGTEGHAILEDLASAIDAAKGGPVRIRTALLDAKKRMRALLVDTVPIEPVRAAVCSLFRTRQTDEG